MIPKPGGGERPLGIPSIKDRVVQTAAKIVLEPIFEADMEPSAYGYRPRRSAQGAIQKVHKLVCEGYTDVVDADLSKYYASTSLLSRPAQASHALRPAELLTHHTWALSRGCTLAGFPTRALASYQVQPTTSLGGSFPHW
jgi:hypothetical protein